MASLCCPGCVQEGTGPLPAQGYLPETAEAWGRGTDLGHAPTLGVLGSHRHLTPSDALPRASVSPLGSVGWLEMEDVPQLHPPYRQGFAGESLGWSLLC